MVEWKWRESRQCLQLASAILLSISVSFAFCQRTRRGQNMRSSGESSQRSCSSRKNSFENTSPTPRRTKDVSALPVHAVYKDPLQWKAQGICNTAKCATCRASGWRVDTWKVIPWWPLYIMSSFGGEGNTLRSQSFPIVDSNKEYLPGTAMWFSCTFVNIYIYQTPMVFSSNTKHFMSKPFIANERKPRCTHSVENTIGNQPPSQQLPKDKKGHTSTSALILSPKMIGLEEEMHLTEEPGQNQNQCLFWKVICKYILILSNFILIPK